MSQTEPNETMCRSIRRERAALKTNDLEVMSTSINFGTLSNLETIWVLKMYQNAMSDPDFEVNLNKSEAAIMLKYCSLNSQPFMDRPHF